MKPADIFCRNCLALNYMIIHPAIFQPSFVEARTQKDGSRRRILLRGNNIKFSNFIAHPTTNNVKDTKLFSI